MYLLNLELTGWIKIVLHLVECWTAEDYKSISFCKLLVSSSKQFQDKLSTDNFNLNMIFTL